VLGRTFQAVPFGATDGRPTRVFFMICCGDDRIHLHTLARLCLIAQKTDVIAQLHDVATASEAYEAMVAAEKGVLPAAEESAAAVRPKSRQS
jgi:PTS system nitrogen regulatory IIA component